MDDFVGRAGCFVMDPKRKLFDAAAALAVFRLDVAVAFEACG